jgi:hypothetical protein
MIGEAEGQLAQPVRTLVLLPHDAREWKTTTGTERGTEMGIETHIVPGIQAEIGGMKPASAIGIEIGGNAHTLDQDLVRGRPEDGREIIHMSETREKEATTDTEIVSELEDPDQDRNHSMRTV